MNIEKLQADLAADEGVKCEIYLDHLEKPTCGIGHLVRESDPEYEMVPGTAISQDRVDELFRADVEQTLLDCVILHPRFNEYPEAAQLVMANMCFQLGLPKFLLFKKSHVLFENGMWSEAADEILNSKWAKQTPNRANRLADRLRQIT
jgi:lysozyme